MNNPVWYPGDRVDVAGHGPGYITDYVQSTGRTEVELDDGNTVVVQCFRLCRVDDTDPQPNVRARILRTAETLVNGPRNVDYGDPRADFKRTAAMWSAYLDVDVQPHDVAALMCLLKVSRIAWSPQKEDSWTDLAGYAACGADCALEDE